MLQKHWLATQVAPSPRFSARRSMSRSSSKSSSGSVGLPGMEGDQVATEQVEMQLREGSASQRKASSSPARARVSQGAQIELH